MNTVYVLLTRILHWIRCPHRSLRWVILPLLLMLAVLFGDSPLVEQAQMQTETAPSLPAQTQNLINTEQPWWQDVNVTSGAIVPAEMQRLVNVVGWGGLAELPRHQQRVWRQAERMHAEGGRYVGAISTLDATYETYIERPELANAAVIDIHGDPMIVPWESTVEEPRWWGNTNDPVWQAFLLEQGKALVDAGVDGIIIDEIEGTVTSAGYGGSFGEPDMTQFREYLANRYMPQELRDQFDIKDIETFDYGKYVRDRGLAGTWMNSPWEVPLYGEFMRFQRLAIVEFMTRLVNETKSYAQTTYGREVAFTANVWGLYPHLLIFADLLDYYTVEYPYIEHGYPPASQAILEHKLARALGDKPAILLPNITTVADLVHRPSSSTLMSLYIAESYASLGALMVPYGIYGWSEAGGPTWYYGDMSILAPSYRFVWDNPFLYKKLDSQAQVAVLYSFPTDYHRGNWHHDRFRGLAYALLDGQVQYDIVPMGDNVWITDSFSLDRLEPYQLVFLPGAAYLSDAQVDLLLSFVAAGGTLVAWGDTGIYDEMGQETERPELETLTEPGTHAYGDGRFITMAEDLGERYLDAHDPTVRQQLVSLANEHTQRITVASAPRTLNVLAYEGMVGSQFVAHLINYDYNVETDEVQPTEPFTLTTRPPSGFLDQDEIQVYSLSPHHATSLLDFTVNDNLLIINHPGVGIYDALVAIPEVDARTLANDTLDTLTEAITQAKADDYNLSSLDDLLSQIDDAGTAGNHLLARQLGIEALDRLQALTRLRILFDEAHAERNTLSWERALRLNPDHPDWIYFGLLAGTLEDDFVFERNTDARLSFELLQQYDALILAAPWERLSSAELQAVEQYVRNGGGLLVLGDCGLDGTLNPITSIYDITVDSHCIFVSTSNEERQGDFVIDEFADHPAVTGVPFMMTNWGESLTVQHQAVPLAFTDANSWQDSNWNGEYDPGEQTGPFTMIAAHERGPGRVVAVADNAFQDDGFEWRSNDLLMRSLLNWLSRRRPPDGNRVHLPLILLK